MTGGGKAHLNASRRRLSCAGLTGPEKTFMPPNELATALADLRRSSERLWAISNKIFTTEYALEVRSATAAIDSVANQIEATLAERKARTEILPDDNAA